LTISRRGCFSGRPPTLGEGSSGSINSHCSSDRSESYPRGDEGEGVTPQDHPGGAQNLGTTPPDLKHVLRHLAGFAIRRIPLAPFLERMWELRENVTPYDAAYVALAERLDGALITCDTRLGAASGVRCTFDLIA